MSIYKQRDIVLVSFPFSDQSQVKVRPALVLSNDFYNRTALDLLVCGLTTNLTPIPYSVLIQPTDLETPGSLRHVSRVKADAIAQIEKNLVIKSIARLKSDMFQQVIIEIIGLIALPKQP